ncbi:hypothetical protein PASE110613_14410 [Paenibacillus sediminis]|uniref:Uncharacterized protein n=1 Tax=Paenibacillus sediminis TaxID=664909 RepID=A0ABS4H7N0_9BACL|nr:hypothetical protein [Paenibacillus sediminis]
MMGPIQNSNSGLGILYFFCLGAGVGVLIYWLMIIIENRRK